jgi:2-polyprenyl-3-methyl-5-hydroxy-6-metoxy-1,4-benzoquinol methylase
MRLRRLLAVRGIHFFVTRFGPAKFRGFAFDEKFGQGGWNFAAAGEIELATVVSCYLGSGDLLIMGCGGASILENLDIKGLGSVLGIDLSGEAIRLADRFSSDRVTFLQADMVNFVCPRSYDVILFSESLYYVPATQRASLLKRLAGHLKPGGAIIATFSQVRRYRKIIENIRRQFLTLQARTFTGSNRYLMVFRALNPAESSDPSSPEAQS